MIGIDRLVTDETGQRKGRNKMAYTNIDGITVDQFNEIITDIGYYDDEVYNMADFNSLYGSDPYEAIMAAYNGGRYGYNTDQFNPYDEYFIFDGYGNVVSLPDYYFLDYANHQFKDDILDYVNENEIELEGVEED